MSSAFGKTGAMTMSFKKIVLISVVEVVCLWQAEALREANLISLPVVYEKICPPEDVVISNMAISLITCTIQCFRHFTCGDVFYNEADLTCTGCQGYHTDPTGLADSPGTVYVKLDKCEQPPIMQSVDYSQFTGDLRIGSSFTYTCNIPCGSYPLPGNDVITCLPDSTWTSPQCWDSSIPPGTPGCVSTYGAGACGDGVSNSYYMNGDPANCYCDAVCCANGDCCYDSGCPPA